MQTADGSQVHLFYAKNIAGGANTVTAHFSASNGHPWLAIYEYSGLSTTSPLDQKASAQGNSTTPSTGATPITTSANELVFVGAGLPSTSGVTVTARQRLHAGTAEHEHIPRYHRNGSGQCNGSVYGNIHAQWFGKLERRDRNVSTLNSSKRPAASLPPRWCLAKRRSSYAQPQPLRVIFFRISATGDSESPVPLVSAVPNRQDPAHNGCAACTRQTATSGV